MKGFKILITISIILHFCLHPGIFTQSTDQLSKHRGIPIVVKDDKTGEEERVLEEKKRKKRLEEEEKRLAQQEALERAEMERRKAASEKKLKELRQKLAEEEAKLKDIKQEVLSIDAARKEVKMLEVKMKDIVSLISQEKEKVLKQLKEDYDLLINKLKKKPITPKGQFETTEDYNARVINHNEKVWDLRGKYSSDYLEMDKRYEEEIADQTKIYKEQINELKNRKYPVDGLKIELLNYNADKELYRSYVDWRQTKIGKCMGY